MTSPLTKKVKTPKDVSISIIVLKVALVNFHGVQDMYVTLREVKFMWELCIHALY